MNQKPETDTADIERLLTQMSTNNTLDVELNDADIDLLLASAPSINIAEKYSSQALHKMQMAQLKRQQHLPSYTLGQLIAKARSSNGLTLSQLEQATSVSSGELEALESGIWSVEQIVQKFPAVIMGRILTSLQIAVQEFSDELTEIANGELLKASQSKAYARSHRNSSANSSRLIKIVAEYIGELERL